MDTQSIENAVSPPQIVVVGATRNYGVRSVMARAKLSTKSTTTTLSSRDGTEKTLMQSIGGYRVAYH